jgi:cation transport ATPase
MQVDQAALTGESLPTKKFSGDVAFAGSTIKQAGLELTPAARVLCS